MKKVSISKFKAECSKLLEQASRTGECFVITKRGKPWIQILTLPLTLKPRPLPTRRWLGSLKGTGSIVHDVIAPALEEERWEALADAETRNSRKPGSKR